MAPKKEGAKDEDWFTELDAQLEKEKQAIDKDQAELDNHKRKVNMALLDDFWKIIQRFDQARHINMTMDPAADTFAVFESYPDVWRFKENFDFARVNGLQLVDRTQDQGRMGDSIKVWFYQSDSTMRVRMIFQYCEGEHYYKYAGWKRIFAQFVIYDAPLSRVSMDELHAKLGDVVKVWFESHLRKNRDVIIKHLKETYERGETFTE
jgi:hypothetical protein